MAGGAACVAHLAKTPANVYCTPACRQKNMVKSNDNVYAGLPDLDFGNKRVGLILNSYLERRVPSLMFVGPDGTGKEYTAILFAKKILCPNTPPCGPADAPCESCRRVERLEHPGLHLVYPTPSQGSGEKIEDDAADIGKILEEKRKDIFSRYRFPKKVSIRIARARAVIQRANTKPFGGSYNMFIIMDAHTMREEAQNALLKLVEEPPERSVIIWVTSNPEAILYTIRSRCQQVRFTALKPAAVERVLTSYYEVDAAAAKKAAGLAMGSVRRAVELLAAGDDEERLAAYDLLANIGDEPESSLIGRAAACARAGGRDGAARLLHELGLALRDVMCGDEELFINRDQISFLIQQVPRWNRAGIPPILDRIARAREEILQRNLNIEATFVDLFLAIKRARC
jgi:DNA polymerase-3 subunit delta'